MFTWIVTGAAGHLGGTIVRLLEERGADVRGLVLPHESVADQHHTRYFPGDVTRPETLIPLFEGTDPARTIVIHTAGLIDIGDRPYEELRRVNVEGTRNVLSLCQRYGVRRLVYVSSVHAIAQDPGGGVLRETRSFSPDAVTGSYAKTKAEATRDVLEAAADGLNAVVAHPSGILGPYDNAGNHLVQVLRDFMTGKLPACVRGGYDMVDVRDVAWGCVAAALHGRRGECYILSNRRCDISDLLGMARRAQAAGAAPVDSARRRSAAGRGSADARPQAALHRLLPAGARQQRPFFARQGHRGAGLSPARPVPDGARHRALAAKPRRSSPASPPPAPPHSADGSRHLMPPKEKRLPQFCAAAPSFWLRLSSQGFRSTVRYGRIH